MDLLIELVMSLLRGLFGEPEPTADPQRRASRQDRDDSVSAPRGTKSLAEMLEEARRQAAGGGQTPPPRPPPAKPATQVVAKRRPPPLPIKKSVPAIVAADEKPLSSFPGLASASSPSPSAEFLKFSNLSERKPVTTAAPSPPHQPAVELTPVEAGAMLASAGKTVADSVVERLGSADERTRMTAARDGVVWAEIIGPPRALRPYQPSYRRR